MDLLREGLGPFVEREIGVDRLSRDGRLAGFSTSNPCLRQKRFREWDAAGLLNLMEYMWRDVFRRVLGPTEQGIVIELRGWRNKWAHQERLSAADADRALDSALRLLRAVKADAQADALARLLEGPPPKTPSPPPVRAPHPVGRPAPTSQADAIRQYAIARHVEPWRRSGAEAPLELRAGDIEREMGLRQATPNVCSALEGRKFLDRAGLVLLRREGPHRSTTTTFYYRQG